MRIEDFTTPSGTAAHRFDDRERISAKTLILHNDPRMVKQAQDWCRRIEREEQVVADGTVCFDLARLQPGAALLAAAGQPAATHRFSSDGHALELVEDRAEPAMTAPSSMGAAELVFVAIDPKQELSGHWRVWLWAWARSRERGRGLMMLLDDESGGDPKGQDFFADLALIAGLEFCHSRDHDGRSARDALQWRPFSGVRDRLRQ